MTEQMLDMVMAAQVVPAECKSNLIELKEHTLILTASCNEEGHFARECPNKPENHGNCHT